jgi:hypothetical protein
MSKGKRKNKKAHTKIESSSQDELSSDLSANTKQRFQARSNGFFGKAGVMPTEHISRTRRRKRHIQGDGCGRYHNENDFGTN